MPDEIKQRLMEALSSVFPKHAEIHPREFGCRIKFNVAWKLNTDPLRRNKRSRRITLLLSEELIEDYSSDMNMLIGKVMSSVKKRLLDFEPDHDTPYGQPEPEVIWTVES